jgi:hypothetical protein
MTSTLLGSLLPLLLASGIGVALWRSRASKLRRIADIAPGRMVIATNLVSSRHRIR